SWWIMGYGADAEVLDPKELRELIRSNAAKMVKLYGRRARARQAVSKVAETLEPYHAEGP
ncbi:MAG: WYL domain-containing protein, partial [Planctomycetota bacterium]